MKPIDLQSLKLPYIGDLGLYRAVCSCVYRLNRGDSLKSAVKGAAEKYGVPMVAKLEAINRNHMASL